MKFKISLGLLRMDIGNVSTLNDIMRTIFKQKILLGLHQTG